MDGTCQTCGTPLTFAPGRGGHSRRFCSERCRKAQYAQSCIDCGAPTSGSEGRKTEPRCKSCGDAIGTEKRRVWTQELVIARIHEWNAIYGEPPATPDWGPTRARINNDEARARRFEEADGHWPWFNHVAQIFGSWNAAIAAAGFDPRNNTGRGNQHRQRAFREKAAA